MRTTRPVQRKIIHIRARINVILGGRHRSNLHLAGREYAACVPMFVEPTSPPIVFLLSPSGSRIFAPDYT